jgi:hypothetical protein
MRGRVLRFCVSGAGVFEIHRRRDDAGFSEAPMQAAMQKLWLGLQLAGIVRIVGRFRKILVMLLLAIWPAVSSHALLELAEAIHVVHDDHHNGDGSHEQNDDNHAFADGDYTAGTAAKSLKKPDSPVVSTELLQRVSYISAFFGENDSPGPAPPGTAPPLLQKSWSFLLRAALPVRAPSCIS